MASVAAGVRVTSLRLPWSTHRLILLLKVAATLLSRLLRTRPVLRPLLALVIISLSVDARRLQWWKQLCPPLVQGAAELQGRIYGTDKD